MNTKKAKVRSFVMKLRPLLIICILIPLVTFMFYPMANMDPRDLHVGIVNLDTGKEFDQGKVNVGQKIVDKITDTSDDDSDTDSPVVWESYDTKKDAADAMKKGDIYAYLVIPSNFSKKQTSTLSALNTLGTALGKVSTGVDKMGTGVSKMSGNLGKLPTAFDNLSTATGKLATAAGTLNTVSGNVNSEAGDIKDAASSVSDSQSSVTSSLSSADSALDTLKNDVSAGADEDTLNADIEALQSALSNASSASSDASSSVGTINQKAGMIENQSSGIQQGLTGIQTANTNMSTSFATMADKMSAVGPGISKMSKALSTIGDGLGTMSDKLDDKVGTAIDKMNDSDSSSSSSTAKLEFYVDQGNNVLISNTLAGMINGISANTGMQVETTYVNELPDGQDTMYFIMAFMMLAMFSTMIPSILTGLTTRPKGYVTIGSRLKTIAGQLALCVAVAAVVGFSVPRVIQWMCDTSALDLANLSPYIFIFSLGMLVMTVGLFDLVGLVGVAVPLVTMICGTAVASMPYEYLPAFWQQYIWPWEPLRLLTTGIREICYRGGTWWNDGSQLLIWMTIIGLAFMVLSLLKSLKKPKGVLPEDAEESERINDEPVFQ